MNTQSDLSRLLFRIDRKGYKAYKQIKGTYDFRDFTLVIDHVQGDPFAAPSRMRVRISRIQSGIPLELSTNPARLKGLCDYLIRRFYENCENISRGSRGTGKSGLITIDRPGQQILTRSAMSIDGQVVEARFFVGLPARGRVIAGKDAVDMLTDELPRIVSGSLYYRNLKPESVKNHVDTCEDTDAIRANLYSRGLVGFVADGAILPRASGIDQRPLTKETPVAFQSPDSLRVNISLPNRGNISGMGIPEGVTLIVGGGFHGKSTLLDALELGIYNHIPGDGRSMVAARPDTVKIRAADGRNITAANISPFIKNLPLGKPTENFTTPNASGSTSQAANICEALEMGAGVLLLDEDTSATNFMIRDHRMQRLVVRSHEPITPFVDKIRLLHSEKGVSSVLVMGGSGDYFSQADLVIRMTDYQPVEVTRQAHRIAREFATGRTDEGGGNFGDITRRIPVARDFDPTVYRDKRKMSAARLHEIIFGRHTIELWDLEQIVSISQTRALAYALYYSVRHMDGKRTLKEVVERTMTDIMNNSLDILPPYLIGDLAEFRKFELAGTVNRMRNIHLSQEIE